MLVQQRGPLHALGALPIEAQGGAYGAVGHCGDSGPAIVLSFLLAGVTWKRYRPEELPTESPPAASARPPGASL